MRRNISWRAQTLAVIEMRIALFRNDWKRLFGTYVFPLFMQSLLLAIRGNVIGNASYVADGFLNGLLTDSSSEGAEKSPGGTSGV